MFRYDPFSPEAMADPHRFYPTLRDQHPVYRLEEYDGWAISRFADVCRVLQDHDGFSVAEGPVFGPELLRSPWEESRTPTASALLSFGTWDPPHHTRIRRAMMSHFAPKAILDREPAMRRRAEALLDQLVPRGRFDVVVDFAGPFGLANILEILGVEVDDVGEIFRTIQRSTEREPGRPGFTEAGMAHQRTVNEPVLDAIRKRRAAAQRGSCVADALLDFEIDGQPLGDDGVAAQLYTLLLGGAETIPKVFAGGLLELARHRDQLGALKKQPSLVPAAFEEMMRHQGVLQHVGRTSLADVEIGGEKIHRGQRLFLLLQAANRDEREFERGEEFDIQREPRRNLALGLGRHHCIGSHLARLEGRVMLESFLARVPEYEVAMEELKRPASEFQVGYTSMPIDL
jgi:cytochrome P450